jgi:hypothetical protein
LKYHYLIENIKYNTCFKLNEDPIKWDKPVESIKSNRRDNRTNNNSTVETLLLRPDWYSNFKVSGSYLKIHLLLP